MSPLRLNGSTSGYSQLDAPAIAGDQTFTLPGTGGTLDRLNRAGNILQVVPGTQGEYFFSTSTSPQPTGMKVLITPSSATSRIVVVGNIVNVSVGVSGNSVDGDIYRNGIQLSYSGFSSFFATNTIYLPASLCAIDTPGVTTEVTYELYAYVTNISSAIGLGTIFAMEVAA